MEQKDTACVVLSRFIIYNVILHALYRLLIVSKETCSQSHNSFSIII